MTVAENWLKTERLNRAWSQDQLAEISGLSTRTIQRLEQGGSASLETLKALASAFDTEVARLQQRREGGGAAAAFQETAPLEQRPMPSNQQPINKPKAKFQRHLLTYLMVNLGLFLIDIITSSDHLWFYYPLIFWGIPVAWRGLQIYGLPGNRFGKTA
ncbi:2TM domain-containing protein [Sedimenticola sp.]|uniref:2TM domain-containing protein n=1 Tax=Sedimenticola sp. TaxID=1940285 RepID=UPI003D0C487C